MEAMSNTSQLYEANKTSKTGRLEKWYTGLASGELEEGILLDISIAETSIAVSYSRDEQEAKQHFHKAALAQSRLFSLIWEHRDEPGYKVPGNDGSAGNSSGAIHGMHAAMAAGDFELARSIARTSRAGYEDAGLRKIAGAYAEALRKLLLEGDYCGFSHVSPRGKSRVYFALAEVFLAAQSNPQEALAKLEQFERWRKRSGGIGLTFWMLAVRALKAWILTQGKS